MADGKFWITMFALVVALIFGVVGACNHSIIKQNEQIMKAETCEKAVLIAYNGSDRTSAEKVLMLRGCKVD